MNGKAKNIITIAVSVISILAGLSILAVGSVLSVINMDSGENDEALVYVFEAQGIDNIISVKFLESANNGYITYDYYDVVTSDGKYIVEATGASYDAEINSKQSYTNSFNRKTILNDMIEYRSSDAGQYSDSVNSILGY